MLPSSLRDGSPADAEKKGFGGLVNMGLTCYANATLQCLRHSPKVAWLLEDGRFNTLFARDPKPKRALQQPFVQTLAEVVQMLWRCERGQSVRPAQFWNRLMPLVADTMYEHFAQKAPHDSHEFYCFLLESLHEATAQEVEMRILRPPPTTPQEERVLQALQSWQREFSKEYSPFVDLFFGLSHWRTTCKRCGNTSHRWESLNSLKGAMPTGGLGVEPPSLWSLLEEEMRPETIEGYHCEKCPERGAAERSFRIWRLPQVLVVCLKRFTPDGRKIHTRLAALPESLQIDFAPMFSEESPERAGATHYTLRGIVDHHGSSQFGHYTAQARHLGDGEWYLYDDESVHKLSGNRPVFGDSTYVLFFERSSPLRAPERSGSGASITHSGFAPEA